MKSLDDISIRRAAMDLLARREHSALELRQKLARRYPGAGEEIEEEISRLTEENLQSDERLAEAFINSRVRRGQGPARISVELRRKGISEEMIREVLESCQVDWFEQVRAVAARKFGRIEDLETEGQEGMRAKARVSRFLQQRGFSFDHISSLF